MDICTPSGEFGLHFQLKPNYKAHELHTHSAGWRRQILPWGVKATLVRVNPGASLCGTHTERCTNRQHMGSKVKGSSAKAWTNYPGSVLFNNMWLNFWGQFRDEGKKKNLLDEEVTDRPRQTTERKKKMQRGKRKRDRLERKWGSWYNERQRGGKNIWCKLCRTWRTIGFVSVRTAEVGSEVGTEKQADGHAHIHAHSA